MFCYANFFSVSVLMVDFQYFGKIYFVNTSISILPTHASDEISGFNFLNSIPKIATYAQNNDKQDTQCRGMFHAEVHILCSHKSFIAGYGTRL